ncbi:MAG: hypothetical protein ACYTG0_34690 [Planctomycetota bacterium]
MLQRQSRRFEVSGVHWIARRQEPAEGDVPSRSPSIHSEVGIWFENTTGEHRFLKMKEDELPDASEFRGLSGLELGRMLKRAIDK